MGWIACFCFLLAAVFLLIGMFWKRLVGHFQGRSETTQGSESEIEGIAGKCGVSGVVNNVTNNNKVLVIVGITGPRQSFSEILERAVAEVVEIVEVRPSNTRSAESTNLLPVGESGRKLIN